MAMAVVDLLELIDVDNSEHEASVCVPSAVDFMLERDEATLTAESAGERIELRLPKLPSCLLAVPRGGDAICRGVLTVGCRAGTCSCGPCTRVGRMFPGGSGRERYEVTLLLVQPLGGDVPLLSGTVTRAHKATKRLAETTMAACFAHSVRQSFLWSISP